jgi:hypothetical protein
MMALFKNQISRKMAEILNTENIVELYQTLDSFASYYKGHGHEEAFFAIKAELKKRKSGIRDGSKEGILRDEAIDQTFESILNLLNEKFNLALPE